jgi:hypothetical protein
MPVLATFWGDGTGAEGVLAGLGVDGTNAWSGDIGSNHIVNPLTLPMQLDFNTLALDQEIVMQMDAVVNSPDCLPDSIGGTAFCNEAYLGLVDSDTVSSDTEWNTPHSILWGVSDAVGGSRIDMAESVDSEEVCTEAGGRITISNPTLIRCVFSDTADSSAFTPINGEFYHLLVSLRVVGGNLVATLQAGGQFIYEWNMGAVALRPHWAHMLPAYWVDDTADNLSVELLVDVPDIGAPDTGFSPAEQSTQSRRVGWLDWLLGLFGL